MYIIILSDCIENKSRTRTLADVRRIKLPAEDIISSLGHTLHSVIFWEYAVGRPFKPAQLRRKLGNIIKKPNIESEAPPRSIELSHKKSLREKLLKNSIRLNILDENR